MRRLEWRWDKDVQTWSRSAVSVQRIVRGIASRVVSAKLKSYKQGVASSLKMILKAGRDATRGKSEDALWSCDRALTVDPGACLGYLVRGRAKYAMGDDKGAANDFLLSTTCDDASMEVLRCRMIIGDRYHKGMETFEKLKVFVTATLTDSFHDPAPMEIKEMIRVCSYANLGRCYLKMDSPSLAIPAFTEVIESRGETCDIPSMYFYRGSSYCLTHEFTSAVEDFTLACDLTPTDVENYVRRAVAYWSLQDWDEAMKDMDTAVDMTPNDRLYTLRGRLHCCMRNWQDGIMDYKRAMAFAKGERRVNERAKEGLRTAELKQEPLPLVSIHDT